MGSSCGARARRQHRRVEVVHVGNEVTRSGETALYVEFEFTGAVVASNVVDGGVMGISVVNFMQGDAGQKIVARQGFVTLR